jgi:hypothetical protein
VNYHLFIATRDEYPLERIKGHDLLRPVITDSGSLRPRLPRIGGDFMSCCGDDAKTFAASPHRQMTEVMILVKPTDGK